MKSVYTADLLKHLYTNATGELKPNRPPIESFGLNTFYKTIEDMTKENFKDSLKWGRIVWSWTSLNPSKNSTQNRIFNAKINQDSTHADFVKVRIGNFQVKLKYVSNSFSKIEEWESYLFTEYYNLQSSRIVNPSKAEKVVRNIDVDLAYNFVVSSIGEASKIGGQNAGSIWSLDFNIDINNCIIISPISTIYPRLLTKNLEIILMNTGEDWQDALNKTLAEHGMI